MAYKTADPQFSRHPRSGRYAIRFSQRVNRGARRLGSELATLSCRMPARRTRPTQNTALTAAAIGASVTGLALLTSIARRPAPSRLDVATTRLLQRREPWIATRAMTFISAPGFAPLQHVLTVGTALDLWAFGHKREALFTLLTMGAGVTTGVLKIAVGRPRPDPTFMRSVLQFRDNSFPSGHCTHYASFYGYLFYLTNRCMAPSRLRATILATCAGLITFVAPSRVYLGHHWTSDVLAGDLVGLSYLFALIQIYERVWVSDADGRPVLLAPSPA